jgi:hypothetical protein
LITAEPDIWLLPFLACIRKRPGMYLGREDVHTLDTFIFAYALSRRHSGLPPGTTLLDEFRDWIRHATGNADTSHDWCSCVAAVDPSPRNILTFFRYFDDFLAQRGLGMTEAHAERWSNQLLAADDKP